MTSNRIWGLILIIAGLLFLLNNFHIEIFGAIPFWSLVLIGFGVYLIYRAMRKERISDSAMNDFKIFGDTRNDNVTGVFDGADISHFIGDTELNLVNAELKPGVNQITLSSFIGDIRIFVKRDTAVKIHGSNLIGDLRFFDIKREGIGNSFTEQTPNFDTASSKIEITGSSFVGDITITAV